MMNLLFKVLLSMVVSFVFLNGQNFQIEKVKSNIGIPWGMAFLNNDTMIINQRDGNIFLLDVNTKELTAVKNPPKVLSNGQGGLLDVQISPNYKTDGWIYFTYVKNKNNKGVTTLIRAKLKENRLFSQEELLVTKSETAKSIHFGSRITFDEDGYLYFGVGDRGYRPNGQDINTHAGTIMRLHLDGTVPKDNPFVNKNGLDEIYSYGHRNPQGLFYDKLSKTLFEVEHGPRGGDEINIIKKGLNYGWSTVSYGKEYWSNQAVGVATTKEGIKEPIKVYIPSIAPSSLMVYSGKAFKNWKGNLFMGALVLKHLNMIVINKDLKVIKEERFLENLDQRIRNVIEAPNGWIYLATDSGNIYRLRP
jgi:glucose/arabinose dehydrogenase